MYFVSHLATHEPSGMTSYPDKEFTNYDEARNYYASLRNEYKKRAEKVMKDFPRLFTDKSQQADLWNEDSNCDPWVFANFTFHENYTYHHFALEEI